MEIGGSLFLETWRRQAARLDAIAVTLMRPSKLKWELGPFGTFTPTERIYARIYTLCRLGADEDNYTAGIYGENSPREFTPFEAGSNIIAHEHAPGASLAAFCYVTETDVAAVKNPTITLARMMAYLARDAALTHYQAHASGPSSGGSTRNPGSTAVTPGTHGSMITEMVGQGYECDIVGTVAGTDYVIPSLATKNANNADNDWGYAWFGRVPLMLPIAATMDSKTFAWALKVFTADTTYDANANLRVAALPADWDLDVE
jgi:hypothetical protein